MGSPSIPPYAPPPPIVKTPPTPPTPTIFGATTRRTILTSASGDTSEPSISGKKLKKTFGA